MNFRIIFYALLSAIAYSCGQKPSELSEDIPVIRLNPDTKDTLKVSEYFSRVDAFLLKDTFFFYLNDFVEFPDHYLALAMDNASLLNAKKRFYIFDKKGHFTNMIGNLGRGPGEYQSMLNGLEVREDSIFSIIDYTKFLNLTLNGQVVSEQKINLYDGVSDPRANPVCLLNDSLVVFYSELLLTGDASLLKKEQKRAENMFMIEYYSLNTGHVVRSFFPMKNSDGLAMNNVWYNYRDSLCFYHDKEQVIYQLFPDHLQRRYRLDKGKYDRLQSVKEYDATLCKGVNQSSVISMNTCNETDQYVMGKYVFKNRIYIFIYNKQTGQTKNYRWVNNDLLGTGVKSGMRYLDWQGGLPFKQDYLWYCFNKDWVEMIDRVKANLSVGEWKKYKEQHPDFIRFYDELLEDQEKMEASEVADLGKEGEKMIILRYYFN